jgi:hypothetical protein
VRVIVASRGVAATSKSKDLMVACISNNVHKNYSKIKKERKKEKKVIRTAH